MNGTGAGPGARVAAGAGAVADAFWRAAAYCLHPRAVLSSLLPLALAGGALGLLGWWGWEAAVAAVRGTLERWQLVGAALGWLEAVGAPQLRTLVAPLILVALATPAVAVLCLLLVAGVMVPPLVRLVVARRLPGLRPAPDAPLGGGPLAALGLALLALAALAATAPLWLMPPLVAVLPPLIVGALVARVLPRAVLARHAGAGEGRELLRGQRGPLRAMGLCAGLLALLPAALWSLSPAALIFAPLLMVAALWLHLVLFTFAALWFAHFLLPQLQWRRTAGPAMVESPPTPSP